MLLRDYKKKSDCSDISKNLEVFFKNLNLKIWVTQTISLFECSGWLSFSLLGSEGPAVLHIY